MHAVVAATVRVVHFFEPYNACGVQDATGKAERIALIKAIGFKHAPIYNYHVCCLEHIESGWTFGTQPRWELGCNRFCRFILYLVGLVGWNGLYLIRGQKTLKEIKNSLYFADSQWGICILGLEISMAPRILSRRLCCQFEGFRGTGDSWYPEINSDWKVHKVGLKRVLSDADSKDQEYDGQEQNRPDRTNSKYGSISHFFITPFFEKSSYSRQVSMSCPFNLCNSFSYIYLECR